MLLALEVIRGACEYTLGVATQLPLRQMCQKGDGHPVIVFPGLAGADESTHFLRNFLGELNYSAYSWGQGRNYGPRNGMEAMLETLKNRVQEVSDLHGGQQVSLIGWSLGGIYAREVSKHTPELVRQVITLGTPFKGLDVATNAARLYQLLSGDRSHVDKEIHKRIEARPPVPFTSIYSKTDGVVSWECSLEAVTDKSENIEIPGASHLGLGHNPLAMFVIANRLSQPNGDWKPFKA